MNSRIANAGTKMPPLKLTNPLILGPSLQHSKWQKIVNLLQLEMNRGKLREKLETCEICELAQQREYAIRMEEMKMMNSKTQL
jgi:hypothetical protein